MDKQRIEVDADALRQVLYAFNGQPHLIRELQVTRNISTMTGLKNPIDTLEAEYAAWIKRYTGV